MSLNNVKLLNEINRNIASVLEKYIDNYTVLEKINGFVKTEFDNQLKKIQRDVDNLEKLEKEKNYFINKFLSSMENIFYYVKSNDAFIHYDMKHYKIYEEDILINQIYKDITINHPCLHPLKFNILQDIVNELKQQHLFDSLPESYTIQSIIKYLMTYFFETKDDAKYFCCVIGDIVLNKHKHTNINFCINDNLFCFINRFNIIVTQGLRGLLSCELNNNTFLNNTIGKSTNLNHHRIIKSKQENQQYLWNDFLNKHAIDLLVVCIHYSKRYLSSEHYIKHHKEANTILYLKDHTAKQMVEEFCLNHLTIKKESEITYDTMEFLWHMFLSNKYIPPNIVTKQELHQFIKSYIKYDHQHLKYISIFHDDSQLINHVKTFLNITLVADPNDELEVSELIAIFEEQQYDVNESIIVELIKYFTSYNLANDNKTIQSVRCELWDKKGELKKFIDVMKQGATSSDYPITQNLTINAIYTKYCKYTSNHGNVRKIVTKRYFVSNIMGYIPETYILFNKIDQRFWYD